MRIVGWQVHRRAMAPGEQTPVLSQLQLRARRSVGPSPTRSEGIRMTMLSTGRSSTMPLAGRPRRSGVMEGSDFLPYPKQGGINQNEQVSAGMGRRLRAMADTAQFEGASRLRIRHSPQSEEERGVRSAPRSRLYWVGRKGFEGFMQVTHGSEGVPPRRGLEESGDYWIEALTATRPTRRCPTGPAQRFGISSRSLSATAEIR